MVLAHSVVIRGCGSICGWLLNTKEEQHSPSKNGIFKAYTFRYYMLIGNQSALYLAVDRVHRELLIA